VGNAASRAHEVQVGGGGHSHGTVSLAYHKAWPVNTNKVITAVNNATARYNNKAIVVIVTAK